MGMPSRLVGDATGRHARAEEPDGAADLYGALCLVAAGRARSVTLCGFPDGMALLRIGRELAIDGIALDSLVRQGGGIDVRVRLAR